MRLAPPGSCPFNITEHIQGDIYIFDHLKILHSDTNKIGAVIKCIFESMFRLKGARSKCFECYPWLLERGHVCNCFLRLVAKIIVFPPWFRDILISRSTCADQ